MLPRLLLSLRKQNWSMQRASHSKMKTILDRVKIYTVHSKLLKMCNDYWQRKSKSQEILVNFGNIQSNRWRWNWHWNDELYLWLCFTLCANQMEFLINWHPNKCFKCLTTLMSVKTWNRIGFQAILAWIWIFKRKSNSID